MTYWTKTGGSWVERYRLTALFWSLIRTLDAWTVLLLIVLGLWISNAGANEFGKAQQRDCAEIARAFLAQHHMKLETAPRVFITVPIKLAGWFDSGFVFIRNDKQDECAVYVHEFVHAWQYQQYGPARTQEEWLERERQAVRVELMWRGE
jgi:hypothetical protein